MHVKRCVAPFHLVCCCVVFGVSFRVQFGASTVFHMTWVPQLCSVDGLDDVDGVLAGFVFVGLIIYVLVRAPIL